MVSDAIFQGTSIHNTSELFAIVLQRESEQGFSMASISTAYALKCASVTATAASMIDAAMILLFILLLLLSIIITIGLLEEILQLLSAFLKATVSNETRQKHEYT